MNNKKGRNAFVRLTLTFVALVTAGELNAQSLRVTAADSSADNAVYDVLFNPAGTTPLNSDGSSMGGFRSAVFVPGSTSGVDLIVADTVGGKLVRYVAPTGSPTESAVVVWSAATSGTPGPQNPDGLSVDSAGNLYVITNKPRPAVWVLPPSTAAAGGFGAPVLLDSKFAGLEVDALVETVIVPSTSVTKGLTAFGISPGDLLVLVADTDNDPSDRKEGVTVFDYPASSIAAFLASPGTPIAAPAVALKEAQLPVSSKKAAVPVPTGMDIWPVDGSLLLSTTAGTILQYALPVQAPTKAAWWTQSSATTFANVATSCTSTPCFGKLRTGAQTNAQTSAAYAFVTQPTGATSGNILQFAVPLPEAAAPSFSAPTLSVPVTTGSPQGLAVGPQSVVVASASTCATTSGCNPTGGLSNAVTNGVTGNGAQGVSGNVIQQSCIVTDTRLVTTSGPTYGSCPGTIDISQACPGFPANIVPSTICGASGPNGNQFAIILSIANGVDNVPGILVQSQADPSTLIPNAAPVPCTNQNQVVGWTPRLGSNEGTITEGANVVDMTTFCDKGGSSTKGNSVWMVGGQLSTAVTSSTGGLVSFANQKLQNLGSTIQSASIAQPTKGLLGLCLATSAVLLNTKHYACAARNIYVCDQIVAKNASAFSSSASNSNPFGEVRGRLGSLFYTINTRIAGNPANPAWPLTAPPAVCDGDGD